MRTVRIFLSFGAFVLFAGLMAGLARGEGVEKSATSPKLQSLKNSTPSSPAPQQDQSAHEKNSARSDSVTNYLSLKAELRQEIVPGFPPATRVIGTAGTNKFTFLAPRGFRVDASDPKKITLVSSNETTFITLRIRRPLPAAAGSAKTKPSREKYRERLLSEHSSEKVLSEFSRNVDGHSGFAFDVQWSIAGGSIQSARVVFVPTPEGLLEFRLKTTPNVFRASAYKFNNVLLSFRASRNGDLEIVPLSNKF